MHQSNKAQTNHYTVPASSNSNGQLLLINASLWRRGFNLAVDMVIIKLLSGLLLPAIWLLTVEQRFFFEFDYELLSDGTPSFIVIVLIFYYAFFDGVIGRTPGRILTSTYLVDQNGRRPEIWRTLLRSVCRAIPFDFISIFLSRDRRCWHDQFSATSVVVKV